MKKFLGAIDGFSHQFLHPFFLFRFLQGNTFFGQETTESQRLGALLSPRKRLVKGIRKRALTSCQSMGGKWSCRVIPLGHMWSYAVSTFPVAMNFLGESAEILDYLSSDDAT